MTLRLDHVVIAVHDLAAAMADYQALGFQVLPGGAHAGRLSHNALVVFDDGAYLELIAWRGDNDESWYRVLQAHGEGFVDHALLPQAMARDVAAALQRGLQTLRPISDGGRLRPDGQHVAWQLARQTTRALPFLCGDVTPRSLRVPEGPVRQQANGVTGVAAVLVAVPDLAGARADLQALLGVPVLDGPGAAARQAVAWLADAGVACAHGGADGCDLVLVAPDATAPAPSAAAQHLAQRLATRGPGPCALVLHGLPAASSTAFTFDPQRCHGASLHRLHP